MPYTDKPIRLIKPHEHRIEVSSGEMIRLEGVSEILTNAEGIHMAVARIPPMGSSSAHYHVNCESGIYVAKGHGRFLVGDALDEVLEMGPGYFLYVPPGAVHQPVNDSDETMELIVARNTPVEVVQEWDAKERRPIFTKPANYPDPFRAPETK
ncbi:MAG: cupin domain-containing protein [SAR202 cluster bacterium]|nr:cupin domain-containing protein [SAR202 cluster bacterium]